MTALVVRCNHFVNEGSKTTAITPKHKTFHSTDSLGLVGGGGRTSVEHWDDVLNYLEAYPIQLQLQLQLTLGDSDSEQASL
jgi:hypothetical protein